MEGPTQSIYDGSNGKDVMDLLQAYLAKKDGVDKLIKLCRYTAKFAVFSGIVSGGSKLHERLKSFDSSLDGSQKAFRLGRFVEHINALRPKNLNYTHNTKIVWLNTIVHLGEGIKSFLDHLLWLVKANLIDVRQPEDLQRVAAWASLVAHVLGVPAKVLDGKDIMDEMGVVERTVKNLRLEGLASEEMEIKLRRLQKKLFLQRLAVVREMADTLMAIGDLQHGKGSFLGKKPLVLSCLGFLSALISAHKNWVLC